MDSNVIRASAVSALRGIEPTPIHAQLVADWQNAGIDTPAEVQ